MDHVIMLEKKKYSKGFKKDPKLKFDYNTFLAATIGHSEIDTPQNLEKLFILISKNKGFINQEDIKEFFNFTKKDKDDRSTEEDNIFKEKTKIVENLSKKLMNENE